MRSTSTKFRRCVTLIITAGLLGFQSSGMAYPDTAAGLRLAQTRDEIETDGEGGGRLFLTEGAHSERLWSQTKLLFGIGVFAVGVLYAMPTSITGWDRDVEIKDLPERWWNNISRPPIWDSDHWFFNYIGHPYCGGVYYQMARKSGYQPWDSFLYAFIMSSFFWEYGVEAFAERPSIQDLVITPVGGWLYGEWAFNRERAIIANDSRVMGSKTLGNISLFFLDPMDHFGRWINSLSGRDWIITGSVVFTPPAERTFFPSDLASDATFQPGLVLQIERTF